MKKGRIDEAFGSLMVLVPHQDDEILMCAGILYQAVRAGLAVTVVMVTNGDYGCADGSVGRRRLQETLESLKVLGVKPEQVEFLGYADTGMEKKESFLYQLYEMQDGDQVVSSHCSDHTYGLQDKPEFHWKRWGEHGPLSRNSFKQDLKEVLLQYKPEHLFTTSEYDFHGDHSGLYLLTQEIFGEMKAEGRVIPELFSGVVHSLAGDENWPLREDQTGLYTCPNGFEETSSLLWEDRISFDVPDEMKVKAGLENLKWLALSKHVTALKPDAVDFLNAFVKKEEIFWLINNKGEADGIQ